MCACDNAANFKVSLLLRYLFFRLKAFIWWCRKKSEIFYANKRHTQIFFIDSRRIFSLPLSSYVMSIKRKKYVDSSLSDFLPIKLFITWVILKIFYIISWELGGFFLIIFTLCSLHSFWYRWGCGFEMYLIWRTASRLMPSFLRMIFSSSPNWVRESSSIMRLTFKIHIHELTAIFVFTKYLYFLLLLSLTHSFSLLQKINLQMERLKKESWRNPFL